MNPRYHHRNIPQPQQPFYYNPYPVFPVPLAYDQVMSTHARYYNPGSQFVEYVGDVAILNSPNTLIHYPWVMINQQQHDMYHSSSYYLNNYNYDQYYYPTQENTSFDSSSADYSREFEEFLEESMILLNLLADESSRQQVTATGGASGSGLPEEKILEHLQVYTVTQGKKFGEEVDVCSICLDDYYEKKEKVAVLECGHRFHVECIKSWLMSKNVCPMCRATALKV